MNAYLSVVSWIRSQSPAYLSGRLQWSSQVKKVPKLNQNNKIF